MRAKCFSEDDKKLLVERVRDNQTGIQNKTFRREQMIEALKDPQTWCFGLIQILTTLPTSGLGAFANIIINGFHFTILQTQLLAMVLGAYIIIVLLGTAWLVKKYGQNLIIMFCAVLPFVSPPSHPRKKKAAALTQNRSIAGTVILMTVENTSKSTSVGLLISYYICLSFWVSTSPLPTLLTPTNPPRDAQQSASPSSLATLPAKPKRPVSSQSTSFPGQ